MRTLFAAVSALGLLYAAPALAQASPEQTGVYLNLGYTHIMPDDILFDGADMGALQGRLGYRLHRNFAVEGEGGLGVSSGDFDLSSFGQPDGELKVKTQLAAYAVALLPLTDRFDVFARLGYGTQDLKVTMFGGSGSNSRESVNYGVGAQYSFDGKNGVRGEYTRYDFEDGFGKADTLSLSYVRRF